MILKTILNIGKILKLYKVVKAIVQRMIAEKTISIKQEDAEEFLVVLIELVAQGLIPIPGVSPAEVIDAIKEFRGVVVAELPSRKSDNVA